MNEDHYALFDRARAVMNARKNERDRISNLIESALMSIKPETTAADALVNLAYKVLNP